MTGGASSYSSEYSMGEAIPTPWAMPTPTPWAMPTPTPWAMPTPTPWAMPHRLVHRDLPNAHAGLTSQTARQTARQTASQLRPDHHQISIQVPRGMRQECLRWLPWTLSMARHLGTTSPMVMKTVTVLMTELATWFVTAKVLVKVLATLPSTARIAEEE